MRIGFGLPAVIRICLPFTSQVCLNSLIQLGLVTMIDMLFFKSKILVEWASELDQS